MQHKIASIQAASWPDSHEKGWETKAPHNHHLLSFPCHSADASPAGETRLPWGAASCPVRGILPFFLFFLTLAKPPKLACHIYRANLLFSHSRASAQLQKAFSAHGMSWWLSWHLWDKWTHLINSTWCHKKARLTGRNGERECSRWVAYLSWLKLRSSRRAKWP